jgi:hypothetical protein
MERHAKIPHPPKKVEYYILKIIFKKNHYTLLVTRPESILELFVIG